VSFRQLIVDPATLDFDNIIADAAEIRKYNPQRYEMEQLTAIVYEDLDRHICAGYKDVSSEEFWVRGHMPNMPLLPGVLMLESAAQMCSYFSQRYDLLGCEMIGFGGLEEVKFRDPVLVRRNTRLSVPQSLFHKLEKSNVKVDSIRFVPEG